MITGLIDDAGRQRYLTRPREKDTLAPLSGFEPPQSADGAVWTDYAGMGVFADFAVPIDPQDPPPPGGDVVGVPTRAHVPGVVEYDYGDGVPAGERARQLFGNLIGTREAECKADGTVTARTVYTAFGEPVNVAGSPRGRYGYAGAWGYQSPGTSLCGPIGEQVPCDPLAELGWLHVGERYYDPAVGRFVQRDPIGIRGGFNTYQYVLSSPTANVDPAGLWTLGIEIELSFAILGGVKISGGFHIGYSKYDGLTGGATVSVGVNVGPQVVGSCGIDVEVTNADGVPDLVGIADEINLGLGPINVERSSFQGRPRDGVPTQYRGYSVGLGAGGSYGISYGKSARAKLGRGNSTPIRGGNPGL